MKRLLALIIALVCLSALCVPALAATEDTVTVYVDAPDSWSEVHLYAWYNETDHVADWPGDKMTDEGDGWYSLEIPADIPYVIATDGNGAQTSDLVIDPGWNLWITVADDLSAQISYTEPSGNTVDVTDTDETVIIHASVPADWADPCCWAWLLNPSTNAFENWPGEAMTQDGDWYTIEVPAWIDSLIINGNGGSVQTSDLSVESGKEVWVVVAAADDASVSYTEPTVSVPEVTEPEVTEPEVTEPETTAPEVTEPETTAPETTEPTNATQPTEDNSGNAANSKLKMILVICLVLVSIIAVAVIISVVPKRHA